MILKAFKSKGHWSILPPNVHTFSIIFTFMATHLIWYDSVPTLKHKKSYLTHSKFQVFSGVAKQSDRPDFAKRVGKAPTRQKGGPGISWVEPCSTCVWAQWLEVVVTATDAGHNYQEWGRIPPAPGPRASTSSLFLILDVRLGLVCLAF